MALFTTNYADLTSNINEPLPDGVYEFVIKSVRENATKNGAESIQFNLVVRNDLDQALPETNGKYHNRHLWVDEWRRRATNKYDTNNMMYFMKAAGIPEGTPINSMEDFYNKMIGKPVRIHIKVTDNKYNGTVTKVNRPAPWDWEPSKFPNVQHVYKGKDAKQNDSDLPFSGPDTTDQQTPF